MIREGKVKCNNFARNILKYSRDYKKKQAEYYEIASYIKLLLFLTLKHLFRCVAALNRLQNIVLYKLIFAPKTQ